MLQPSITTITNAGANVSHQLYTLLNTARPGMRRVCSQLKIQADPFGGSTHFATGNSDVAAGNGTAGTGVGVQVLAGQTYDVGPFESNLIHLDEIYVVTDAASAIFHVTVVTR